MMSSPPSSSSEDFVHIQHNNNSTTDTDEETANNIGTTIIHHDDSSIMNANSSSSPAATQRSLLRTLWSEAASTSDLHQRRNKKVVSTTRTTTTSLSISGPNNDGNSSPPKQQQRGKRYNTRNYSSNRRMKRVATKVWLAALAALVVALLVRLHVFLYQVLTRNTTTTNQHANASKENVLLPYNNNNEESVDATTIQKLIDNHNIDPDDTHSKMTLQEAHLHKLTPLLPPTTNNNMDTSQYTIRMNTWHRNEQLLLSINHHAKCEGVAEIQIIWCDTQNDPPDDILHHSSNKVKIERHDVNSLNERFKIVLDTPTLGILSLDDDVLRPCEALDAAFLRWVRHPERMVGFDVRTHVVEKSGSGGGRSGMDEEDEDGMKHQTNKKNVNDNGALVSNTNWKYGYMSTTEKSNSYSLTLPRASFLHKDYLDLYIMSIPRPIYLYVAQHFECEDIAMSFFVSSLTGGRPPLITDYWAVKSMVKLYSEKKISGGKDHKRARDRCVDWFAELLGVKEDGEWGPLQKADLVHEDIVGGGGGEDRRMFGYGAEPEDWNDMNIENEKLSILSSSSVRLKELIGTMKELKKKSYKDQLKWLKRKKYETMKEAKKVGMIEKTDEWEKRWRKKSGGGEGT
mmetsp:Transcript_19233/g.30082  ORF Transcript_19233/g.30082 Transcript_19233/m.30082 type:complete len:627 (-) Transcript_19233:328-2208(-)